MTRLLLRAIGGGFLAGIIVLAHTRARRHTWVKWLVGVTLLALVAEIAMTFARDWQTLRNWDYPVFYTVAKASHIGRDFYDPAVLENVFRTYAIGVPDVWLTESPGWWYPPPTSLYLAPFGISGYRMALAANLAINLGMIGGSAFILSGMVNPRRQLVDVGALSALLLLFEPTRESLSLGQITFGALLFISLAMHLLRARPGFAGISYALGGVFKPVSLALVAFLPFMRRSRTALTLTLGYMGLVVLSMIIYGPAVISSFFRFGPSDRPAALSMDPVVQSLLGVLRRLLDAEPAGPGALDAVLFWPYLLGAAALGVATLWLVRRTSLALGSALGLTASLAIYPNTLVNTTILLVPALVVLWSSARKLRRFQLPAAVVVGAVFALGAARMAYSGFAAILVTWVALGGLVLLRAASVDGAPTNGSAD